MEDLSYHIKILQANGKIMSWCNSQLDISLDKTIILLGAGVLCGVEDYKTGMESCELIYKVSGLKAFLYPYPCDERKE